MGREKAMGQSTSTMVPRTCVPPNVAPGTRGRALLLVGSPDLCLTCGSTKGRQTLGICPHLAVRLASGADLSAPACQGLTPPKWVGRAQAQAPQP